MPHIGVLLVPPIQLLDISPTDLFAMLSRSYFEACNLPASITARALPPTDLKISYISLSGKGSTVPTTAHLNLSITAGLLDDAVAPGNLDILMVPGPPPGRATEEEVCAFVKGHVAAGVDLLTICSGVQVAAAAGVLDGKRAVGTRGGEGRLEKMFPEVEWVDKRFVVDGRIWSSGGITNGMDMVGWYLRKRWPGLADTVLQMADVEPRGQEYET